MKLLAALLVTSAALLTHSHDHYEFDEMLLDYVRFPIGPDRNLDGEVTVTADAVFAGIPTFAKLPWVQCLTKQRDVSFDIAFLGAPFVSCLIVHFSELILKTIQGHGNIIPSGCPLWPCWNPSRFSSSNPLWWLQCTLGGQSLQVWSPHCWLRRYPCSVRFNAFPRPKHRNILPDHMITGMQSAR